MDDEELGALRARIGELVEAYAQRAMAPRPFLAGATPVPPSGRLIGAPELKLMVEASLDGWLTAGRFNDAFEAGLRQFLGVPHLITVNSGSSANLVAFGALTSPRLGERAIRPGDEVITVAAGFPTTVNPILHYGAVPVFVDVDVATCNVDASLLEAAVTGRTRAVMLAHTLGNPFNVDAVVQLCRRHGLWLVEDCCDALGSTYDGRLVGTFGDIGTLSFYPAHHITMGEGGAVFTRHAELRAIAESLRDWGRDCWCPPGRENTCGRRFCWQLGELPDFIARRRSNFEFLRRRLARCEEFLVLPEATPRSDPSWFGFALTLRPEAPVARKDLLEYLDQRRVGTRLLFGGNLTRQPYMKGRNFRVSGSLERSDRIMESTFWIGLQPALTEEMLDHSASCIEAFLGVAFG